MDAGTLVLDHDENVEAAQEHGVDVGEIDPEDRVGLGGQELCRGRAGSSAGVGPTAGDEFACQRSRIRGETNRSWRSGAGSSLLSALSTARSSHDISGEGYFDPP